ncbi:hypothetical protein [Yoonia sp. R2-816]|uniref:hypothetical protein n=1 Tax=Yoonia sp. R2-816 TaxID=3342638 RepID=UPI003729312C
MPENPASTLIQTVRSAMQVFYDVVYGDDGALLSHTRMQPLNEQVSATYIHTPLTMTVRETLGGADGDAAMLSEKVSTFAPGLCRVP